MDMQAQRGLAKAKDARRRLVQSAVGQKRPCRYSASMASKRSRARIVLKERENRS